MPLPNPKDEETKRRFLERCMSDPTAMRDFPGDSQRNAVCNAKWHGMRANVKKKRAKTKDPQHTLGLRRRYEADMYKRFRWLKGQILHKIVKQDGFGIRVNREFSFGLAAEKVAAFMEWLADAEQNGILEVTQGQSITKSSSSSWQNLYVKSAYQKGLQDAVNNLRKSGATVSQSYIEGAFFRPIHAEKIGLAFTRNFTELKGITQAMDQQISRVLAQGLSEGRNPLEIARLINDRVDSIGITRARTLARTEVSRAHTMASVATYREAGIDGVEVSAAYTTAGDSRVSEICKSLEGKIFTLDQIETLIPAHPNCRCAALPVIDDGEDINLI